MLNLYQTRDGTVFGTTVNTNGQVSADLVLLNVLIELRVMNAMAWDAQRGLVTQTVEQYRNDVVNETANPSI